MGEVTAAPWTVTYAPGSWLALAGPATLVVVPPSSAAQAAELWPLVAAARSIDELTVALARYRVDELDRFAAFFVENGTLRTLTRGDLELTLSDERLRPGDGVRTWTETELADDAVVALTLDAHASSVRLPLLAGAALVSAVVIDQSAPLDLEELATAEAQRTQPSEEAEPTTELPTGDPAHSRGEPGRPDAVADAEARPNGQGETAQADAGEAGADEAAHPHDASKSDDDPLHTLPLGDDAGTVLAPPQWRQGVPAGDVAGTVLAPPQWTTTDARHAYEGEENSGQYWPPQALPPTQSASVATPAEAELLDSIPAWVTHGPRYSDAENSHDGNTVYSTGLATTHKPLPPYGPSSTVLAAMCTAGHANPPASHHCRRCGAPVNQGTPTMVQRPVLAQLVASTGQYADVSGIVLIGRAPVAGPEEDNAVLMPVPSVSKDISRTHCRVEVRDWALVATDMNSTNGTLLLAGIDPGGRPRPLTPGDPTPLQIGDSLDLGDGVVIHIGTPR